MAEFWTLYLFLGVIFYFTILILEQNISSMLGGKYDKLPLKASIVLIVLWLPTALFVIFKRN